MGLRGDLCTKETGNVHRAGVLSPDFLFLRMSLEFTNSSVEIVIGKNEEKGLLGEVLCTSLCTKETGNVHRAGVLSPNFLFLRMSLV
jgi:hypothetical protein